MSACIWGVAVAVKATIGTPGKVFFRELKNKYHDFFPVLWDHLRAGMNLLVYQSKISQILSPGFGSIIYTNILFYVQ